MKSTTTQKNNKKGKKKGSMKKKAKKRECKKWNTVRVRNCEGCGNHCFVLVCKHEEGGDYFCSICGKNCNWFWYCRKKCGARCDADDDDLEYL